MLKAHKSITKSLAVAATLGLVAVLGASSSAQADAILTTPVPGTAARNNFDGTIGFEFTVGGADMFVTALGFEDAGLDGLSTAHDVGIWDGAGTLLASVNVPAGSAATLDNAWRYVDLPSQLTLSSGTTYWLGGQTFAGGDAWSDSTASLAVAPEFSYTQATFASGGLFQRPANQAATAPIWGPGNALFTTTQIPEPTTLVLAVLGLIGLIGLRRRRRSKS